MNTPKTDAAPPAKKKRGRPRDEDRVITPLSYVEYLEKFGKPACRWIEGEPNGIPTAPSHKSTK